MHVVDCFTLHFDYAKTKMLRLIFRNLMLCILLQSRMRGEKMFRRKERMKNPPTFNFSNCETPFLLCCTVETDTKQNRFHYKRVNSPSTQHQCIPQSSIDNNHKKQQQQQQQHVQAVHLPRPPRCDPGDHLSNVGRLPQGIVNTR